MMNQIGYCNHCKQNVLLKREDIDICLVIILLIFTAGIGLVIYLIIYYSKPLNRCVHCNSIVGPALSELSSSKISNPQEILDPKSFFVNSQNNESIKFCAYCGEPIKSVSTQYCAHCGTKISE
jgi:hypothetical protein